MAEYANHYFNSYIPGKNIEEQLLTEKPVSPNLQQVKPLDDFVRSLYIGVQQHKVNSSLEYLKGARFSKNSKLVPLASMILIHPVLRKIIYQSGTKCNTCRKAI